MRLIRERRHRTCLYPAFPIRSSVWLYIYVIRFLDCSFGTTTCTEMCLWLFHNAEGCAISIIIIVLRHFVMLWSVQDRVTEDRTFFTIFMVYNREVHMSTNDNSFHPLFSLQPWQNSTRKVMVLQTGM